MSQRFTASVTLEIAVRRDPYDNTHGPLWMWHLNMVRPGHLPPLALGSGYGHHSEQDAWDTARSTAAELEKTCLPTTC